MKQSIPLLGLHCIVDPDGNLIFTHLGTKPEECIESWLDEERVIKGAILGRVTPSWEVHEAEGYRLVTVGLFETPEGTHGLPLLKSMEDVRDGKQLATPLWRHLLHEFDALLTKKNEAVQLLDRVQHQFSQNQVVFPSSFIAQDIKKFFDKK